MADLPHEVDNMTVAQPRVVANTSTDGLNPYEQMKSRAERSEARVAELVDALRLMVSTYPYNPPCFRWEAQVDAHRRAKAALAKEDPKP